MLFAALGCSVPRNSVQWSSSLCLLTWKRRGTSEIQSASLPEAGTSLQLLPWVRGGPCACFRAPVGTLLQRWEHRRLAAGSEVGMRCFSTAFLTAVAMMLELFLGSDSN